ncbi:MAG: polysaccharide biosynthesis C-terminal domain-containing protein, partial [Candidatus Paceibacterota bacterium]
ISHYIGNSAVGIYSVAYALVSAFYLIPASLSQSYFSKFSEYYNKTEKFRLIIRDSISKTTLIMVPTCAILYFVADFFIVNVYGINYYESVLLFKILILSLVFKFYSFPYGFFLSATENQKTRISIQAVTAVFNLVTNLIFIPIYGIVAAAVITVLSEALLAGLYYVFTIRYFKCKKI